MALEDVLNVFQAIEDASSAFQLIVLLTWLCLNTNVKLVQEIFWKVLSSQVVLEQLASTVSITFAPGLLDVVQSISPPTIAWFKTLPTNKSGKRWAVYLLVLQKKGK